MQDLIEQIKRRQWGIIILDEVHLSFAEKFWQVSSHLLYILKLCTIPHVFYSAIYSSRDVCADEISPRAAHAAF
jgi:hypothetical protein